MLCLNLESFKEHTKTSSAIVSVETTLIVHIVVNMLLIAQAVQTLQE